MSGKEDKYIRLMEENREKVVRIASFYCNDRQDVQDLSQEIAYQVWKSLDTFRAESQLSTWLHRIAINTSIQFLKQSKKREAVLNNQWFLTEVQHDEKQVSKDVEVDRMMEAIQKLKEIDKAIVLLYLEKHSHAEISDIMNISISNVGTRMQRIKQRLESLLRQQKL